MSTQIDSLELEIKSSSSQAVSGIERLGSALNTLKSITKGGAGLTTISKQLTALNAALSGVSTGSGKIKEIAEVLNSLSSVQKASGLTSTVNSLKKLPSVIEQLDNTDLDKFADQINRVAVALRPLATEMQKVSNGFAAFPIRIQKIISGNAGLVASNKSLNSSFGVLGTGISALKVKFVAYMVIIQRIGNVIGSWIKESNDYVENLNLFTVAMGEYAEEAQEYAEKVSEVMGIDPSEWLRNQGVFMTLATGFGVAADRAALMSKNLTQLGYDLSSFFNLPVEDAMQKLQSGISGELEPLRRLGFDLSQARLQAVALSLGIDQSVMSMDQAQKAQLRYYAIMTQVTTAQGDMARTLSAPANQLRILQAAATQAARALGNIFIPALNTILPYAIAFLKIVRMVADAIASLFGFKLPEVDYSGISVGVGEVGDAASGAEDSLGGATAAAQEFKKTVLGFDELNVMNDQNKGGSGGGGAGGGIDIGDGFDFELPEYDFLGDAVSSKVDKLVKKWTKALKPLFKWIKDNFKSILSTVLTIAAAYKLWKIGNSFIKSIENLGKTLSTAQKVLAGVVIAVAGFSLEFQSFKEIGAGSAGWLDYLKAGLSSALGIAGTKIALTSLGVAAGTALTIGIGAALLVALVGFKIGQKEAFEAKVDAEVAEIMSKYSEGITIEQFLEVPTEALTSISDSVSVVLENAEKIVELDKKLETSMGTVNAYVGAWAATGEATKEEIGVIIESLDTLITATQEKGSLAAESLRSSIVSAMSNASEETLSLHGNMLDIIYLLESNMNSTVAEWKKELDEATTAYNNLDESSVTYEQDSQELMTKIRELTKKIHGFDVSADDAAKGVKDFGDRMLELNWESYLKDPERAIEVLNNFREASDKAYEDVAEAHKSNIDELDHLYQFVDENSPEWQAIIQEATAIDPSMAFANKEEVYDFIKDYYDQLYKDQVVAIDETYTESITYLTEKLNQVAEESAKGVATDAWLEQADAWAQEWVDYYGISVEETFPGATYQALMSSPLLSQEEKNELAGGWREDLKWVYDKAYDDAIEAAFTDDGDAAKLLQEISDSVISVENQRNIVGIAGTDIGTSLTEGTVEGVTNSTARSLLDNGFEELAGLIEQYYRTHTDTHSPSGMMEPLGAELTAGVAKGIIKPDVLGEVDNALNQLAEHVEEKTVDVFGIGKSNAVMTEKGKSLTKDLETGIRNGTNSVVSAMTTMLDSMLGKLQIFANNARSAMNSILSGYARAMSSVSVNSNGKVSYSSMGYVYVPRMATGGMVNEGQLFIAREAGPELVGTMGGHTAVANNEQIISGIAMGVSNANLEQNALLRQQNELLMELIEKEATVTAVVSASDVVAGLNRKNRRDGRTIVPTGAV